MLNSPLLLETDEPVVTDIKPPDDDTLDPEATVTSPPSEKLLEPPSTSKWPAEYAECPTLMETFPAEPACESPD